jgi:hypothetical protein
LTENEPKIKFYYENLWGKMVDNKTMPITPSLTLLEGLHDRIAFLTKKLYRTDLEKSYTHPEHNRKFKLKEVIVMYAWHSNHHLAHITELKKRMGW